MPRGRLPAGRRVIPVEWTGRRSWPDLYASWFGPAQSQVGATVSEGNAALVEQIEQFIRLADSFVPDKDLSNNNETVWSTMLHQPVSDGGRGITAMEPQIQVTRTYVESSRKLLEDGGRELAGHLEKAAMDSTVVFTALEKARICRSDYIEWWRYTGKPQLQRIVTRLNTGTAPNDQEATPGAARGGQGGDGGSDRSRFRVAIGWLRDPIVSTVIGGLILAAILAWIGLG